MPIDVTFREDDETVIVRGYDNVTEDEMYAMRAEFRRLLDENTVSQALVDGRKITSLMDGNTTTIYKVGSDFAVSGNPQTLRTAIVLPTDPHARRDLEFLDTVEANRGRQDTKLFDDMESAWAWLLGNEE
jgi:hypothetical protein